MELDELMQLLGPSGNIEQLNKDHAISTLRQLKSLQEERGSWVNVADLLEITVPRLSRIRRSLAKKGETLQPMNDEERRAIKIFISHKHENKDYADAIRSQLTSWGLTNEQMHQSSANEASRPIVGSDLTASIKEFLVGCHLVIFVYTHKEFNWEWCSYEIGLADDLTVGTRIVTFQMYDDPPEIQTERVLVKFNQDGIRQFVQDFHKQPDFFPGHGAFMSNSEDSAIDIRAASLYIALKKAKVEDAFGSGKSDRETRWGYF